MRKLQEECGVTEVSLSNFEVLISQYGLPNEIYLEKKITFPNGISSMKNIGYDSTVVEAKWDDYTFFFTGFSWGYTGTGPNGLVKFLNRCGVNLTIQEVSAMDKDEKYFFVVDKDAVVI